MQKEYKTVFQPVQTEIEEKKSRFIAVVQPISSEEEALACIGEQKAKYWDASHHVYSYVLGGINRVQRFSDDGEPAGTAGMPVLEVIRRMELQDLVVVVTRYFGGTLLGAAGLIRAYSKSAAQGIEAAGVIRKQLCIEASVMIEYTLLGKVQNVLLTKGFTIAGMEYQQDVVMKVYVPSEEVDSFSEAMVECTNDRAVLDFGESLYISLSEDGKLII